MPKCPSCGSNYVEVQETVDKPSGIFQKCRCSACRTSFEIQKSYKRTASGKWLMTFWNGDDYIEVYQNSNGTLGVNQKKGRIDESAVTEIVARKDELFNNMETFLETIKTFDLVSV